MILFCAVVAPELVSRDLRAKVLPLYFSRPLRRTDYALAKFAALVTAVWLMLAGPLPLMFLGGVFSADGMTAVRAEIGHWLQGLVVAVVFAVVLGSLALLVASLTARRAVAAALIVAVFLITTPIFGSSSACRPATDRTRSTPPCSGPVCSARSPWSTASPSGWFDPDHGVGRLRPAVRSGRGCR